MPMHEVLSNGIHKGLHHRDDERLGEFHGHNPSMIAYIFAQRLQLVLRKIFRSHNLFKPCIEIQSHGCCYNKTAPRKKQINSSVMPFLVLDVNCGNEKETTIPKLLPITVSERIYSTISGNVCTMGHALKWSSSQKS